MDLVLNIVTIFFLVRRQHSDVHGLSLTNVKDSVLGCSHNNTRFANGSLVPTAEPCLNCKCINANLICSLRVCPEQAFPPPRGCVIVQKKNSCCPYMTCSKLHSIYKDQEKRVVTHDRKWYEQNIQNRILSQNSLQRRIDEPNEEQQFGNGKICVHDGTVYRSGSAMTTSSLCTYCYCIEGKQKCIQPKCTLPAKGCEPIIIDSSCCPVRYDCTENKMFKATYNIKYNRRRNDNKHYLRMTSRMQRSRGCLVDSTFYPEGHKLPIQTNPCEICFCIGGSKRCAPKKCAPMIRNCRPIIPDGQCCPSSYDCKTISDHKTGRGLTSSRQYSEFFSLLFGNEEKGNATASWDFDTEPEPINAEPNATNEKGLLDAIKDSLTHVNGNKQSTKKQTNDPNQTMQPVTNLLNYNISNDTDEGNNNDDDDDSDDEEISLLDYFFKAENTYSSTTLKPLMFNVTGKPLLNGMTNSPMQIQPILPDSMKNGSINFSMLPMSLYNMVKEDGTVMFDADKIDQIPQLVSTNPLVVSELIHPLKKIENEVIRVNSNSNIKTTTFSPKQKTTLKSILKISTRVPQVKPQNETINSNKLNVNIFYENTKTNKTNSASVKNVNETEGTTQKTTETTTKNETSSAASVKTKTTTSSTVQNVTNMHSSIRGKIISPTTKNMVTPTEIITSKAKPTNKTTPIESTTISLQPLTTKLTTVFPKITAVQISSNPSILMDTDISYDYNDQTLPSSLPNLKIIPFLPTDAVKNIIHRNDDYKPNYNYYQSGLNAYVSPGTTVDNTAYSASKIKPNIEKYPTYYSGNVADDRIDYDSYKIPSENADGLDYINAYANGEHQPSTFQLSVNSKLDYGSPDQMIVPSKVPLTLNKNLTVKPPLPPFEPDHVYNVHNVQAQTQQELMNGYIDYSVNSPIANNLFPSEHNYNVPQFITIPPPRRDTVFSYNKNKFIPPAKTEGGFMPAVENYIPLHGSIDEKPQMDLELIKYFAAGALESYSNGETTTPEELNQTTLNFHRHITSTTDFEFKPTEEYNGAFLGVDLLGPYKKQSEDYELENDYNKTSIGSIDNSIPLKSLNGAPLTGEEHSHQLSVPLSKYNTSHPTNVTTQFPTTKPPGKNVTNNSIPLKLITILNNTKKENPSRIEIPQRKNNKIIDPTDESLVEDMNVLATTEMLSMTKDDSESNENLTIFRDVFLSSLDPPPVGDRNADLSEDLLHQSSLFLPRPSLNSLKSKHNFQPNPTRSELDLIIPELDGNKHPNGFIHTNNFSSDSYQVLPTDDKNIANAESYVINPVDVDKLKQHQSNGETEIFTPPHKDSGGLLKLAGCNIYGRMYGVGRIIAELSSNCLECRCTEVGVSCTPLNC